MHIHLIIDVLNVGVQIGEILINFFSDNLQIADKYGFITTLNNEAIGMISWDPRNIPDYIEIGYNCIVSKYKNNGFGKIQLQEACRRIVLNDVNRITVKQQMLDCFLHNKCMKESDLKHITEDLMNGVPVSRVTILITLFIIKIRISISQIESDTFKMKIIKVKDNILKLFPNKNMKHDKDKFRI